MKISRPLRAAQIIALSMIVSTATAQSGRSWMHGIVFADSDTTGLPNATIELIGDQSSERLRSVKIVAKTDQDGKYAIKDIPYGGYTFRVSSDGYEPYEIPVYIGSDMLTQIHVKLKRKK